jgi:hypothetical protein
VFDDLTAYEQFIRPCTPQSLEGMDPRLRIYGDDSIEIWYAPMGALPLNPKIWILGITPGWNQLQLAYQGAAEALDSGLTHQQAAACRKPRVAFAGSMRRNLISMLDDLGLQAALGVESSGDLFGGSLLRTGSVLKYPVFRNGQNYTGHSPKPEKHPALREMLDHVFASELKSVSNCLILPLGKAVESAVAYSVAKGRLDASRVLLGFPHPSGANGHRFRHFAQNRRRLEAALKSWFSSGA